MVWSPFIDWVPISIKYEAMECTERSGWYGDMIWNAYVNMKCTRERCGWSIEDLEVSGGFWSYLEVFEGFWVNLEFFGWIWMCLSYNQIITALFDGKYPNRLPSNHLARMLKNIWHNLSIVNDFTCLDGKCLYIPISCYNKILTLLHTPHPGVIWMFKTARMHYFWSGLKNDVKKIVMRCETCQNIKIWIVAGSELCQDLKKRRIRNSIKIWIMAG